METRQQAIDVLIRFRNCNFNKQTPKMNDQGMNYILMIMSDGRFVTASELADEMNVSMARITTLIQKMQDKDLVVRKTSEEDKRVSYIKLTESGMVEAMKLLEQSIRIISKLIDRVGIERIDEFLDMLGVLKEILIEEGED